MKRYKCVVLVVIILCLALTPVLAKQQEKEQEKELISESFILEIVEKVLGEVRESIKEDFGDNEDDEIENLGRTVKLIFIVQNGSEQPCELTIMCATDSYHVNADLTRESQALELKISGVLRNVEDVNKILLTYHVNLFAENQDTRNSVNASGSAIVEFDTQHILARLGDQTLTVELELVE